MCDTLVAIMRSPVRFNSSAILLLLASVTITQAIRAQDPQQSPSNSSPFDPNVPRKIGAGILPPVLLHTVTYIPHDGFDRIIERPGPVLLEFVIDRKGHTDDIRVLRSCGRPAADWSAVRSVSEFRFKPATEQGQPVAVRIQFEMNVSVITPSTVSRFLLENYEVQPKPPTAVLAVAPKQEPSWFGKQNEHIVEVEFTVSFDGKPINLQIVGRGQEHFDDAALDAVRQCRFKPATLAGEPIDFPMHSSIHFRRSLP